MRRKDIRMHKNVPWRGAQPSLQILLLIIPRHESETMPTVMLLMLQWKTSRTATEWRWSADFRIRSSTRSSSSASTKAASSGRERCVQPATSATSSSGAYVVIVHTARNVGTSRGFVMTTNRLLTTVLAAFCVDGIWLTPIMSNSLSSRYTYVLLLQTLRRPNVQCGYRERERDRENGSQTSLTVIDCIANS